jgi:hypothetical protein
MAKERQDWRELCAAIAEEQDRAKLLALMEELLEVLDERESSSLAGG